MNCGLNDDDELSKVHCLLMISKKKRMKRKMPDVTVAYKIDGIEL